jgi:hypothetical protein
MGKTKGKIAMALVLLTAAVGIGLGSLAALAAKATRKAPVQADKSAKQEPDSPAPRARAAQSGFSLAQFKQLKARLDLKKQLWTTIPWKYSITEARKVAAKTKKPIFMVINTGNCLGCT